jgi:predicted DNA-binding protein (MmcQ/YjbR family)
MMNGRKELIGHCLTYPDVYEDYPFGDDADWALMRHKANKKTFACIYEHKGRLCINLKCEPMLAEFLREQFEAVTAGYHMNKTHWNTVTAGGDVPDGDLIKFITHSYDLTKPRKGKGA